MSRNQFIRKAKLLIGNGIDGIDLSDLQLSFSIKQAMVEMPQTGRIRVYNMARSTAQAIKANEYTRLVLEAGYETGSYGVIFDGEIVQARLGRESAVDTYFDVIAAEAYGANQAVVSTTLAAGSTVQDAATAAAGTMGRPISNHVTAPMASLPRGQALYGMSRDVLHAAAATAGATYFYENGQVVFIPLEGYKDDDVVVMNADTGLIGWPEQTQDGIRLRCLLDPLLSIGSRLQVDNTSIQRFQYSTDIHFIAGSIPDVSADGIYRVCVIEHNGNTRTNDWYSDIVALSIDPADSKLTGLVQKGQFS